MYTSLYMSKAILSPSNSSNSQIFILLILFVLSLLYWGIPKLCKTCMLLLPAGTTRKRGSCRLQPQSVCSTTSHITQMLFNVFAFMLGAYGALTRFHSPLLKSRCHSNSPPPPE